VSLTSFISTSRVELQFNGRRAVRRVSRSDIVRAADPGVLEHYMAERIPTYYRDPDSIAADLRDGYFLRAIADTLARLPEADSFRDSHFGELIATEFAIAAMGLRLLYSKLRLLTAENSNAYKMDVVLYDPETDPIELVFLEVKSSFKEAGGTAPGHDRSIYKALFDSLNAYAKSDLRYDLTAARDRLADIRTDDRQRVTDALTQYGGPTVRYAGVCSIDIETFVSDEASLLATRSNQKNFDVELLCVAEFAQVIDATYAKLEAIRDASC
jgi:hypothetical protein